MNCFLCNLECNPALGKDKYISNVLSEHSKTTFSHLISDIIGDSYLVQISDTDLICKFCFVLLKEFDRLHVESKVIQLLLQNQVSRTHSIYDEEVAKVLEINSKLENLFDKMENGEYSCKKCKFKTKYDKIAVHFKYHEIDKNSEKYIKQEDHFQSLKEELFYSNSLVSNDIETIDIAVELMEDITFLDNSTQNDTEIQYLDLLEDEVGLNDASIIENKKAMEDATRMETLIVIDKSSLENTVQLKEYAINEKLENLDDSALEIEILDDISQNASSDDYKLNNNDDEMLQSIVKPKRKKTKTPICPICLEVFDNFAQCHVHQKTHKIYIFRCIDCSFENNDRDEIIFHRQVQHPDDKRNRYTVSETDKMVNNCVNCGHAVPSGIKCDHGEAIANNQETITCEMCSKIFYSKELITEHLHKIHFICKKCGKLFKSGYKVAAHFDRSHKGKLFSCNSCSKTFITESGFRFHTTKHTLKFNFICDFCSRGFYLKRHFNDHLSIHTGEQNYVCDKCGQTFSHDGTYRLHKLWHDNPYPFNCDQCSKKFKSRSTLKVHSRVHTGERPYHCQYCKKLFKSNAELRTHVSIHTGIFPYNCSVCTKSFTKKRSYSTHMKNEHNILIPKLKIEYKMAIRPVKT